jgi:malonate-semialdehyde dehydrogenase (acetylating) / methylmalonate-semialdehyde dehydrogenase
MTTEASLITHWIGGRAVTGAPGRTAPVFNPATGAVASHVVLAEAADVDDAVRTAAAAFETWSQESLAARTKVLFAFRQLLADNAQRIAETITDEHGKVLADAHGELQRGLEVAEFACGVPQLVKGEFSGQVSADVDAFSFREPLGVAAGITPFNFPAMVPLWMHPVAIATGNTFILKPSERDPSASLILAELWQRAGLPDGVLNVVQGDKAAVDAILGHPGIAAVSFVGSTPVARYVHEQASRSGKRVQALGGAKNHAVVLPDADLEYSADHLVAAAYGSAGERCMAVSVAVAVGQAADPLVEAVARKAKAVRVGPGRDPGSEMGPLVTGAARSRIAGFIDGAQRSGAAVIVDGRDVTVPGYERGFFLGPTLIDHVRTDADVYTEELFGPVLSVVRVDSLDEAIAVINANPYGNGTAVFTESGDAARRFQRGVHVGMIGINVPIPTPMAYYSFGGWKDSLFGDHHIHGPEGVRFYTRAKAVTQRWHGATQSAASYSFPTAD